MELFQDKIIFVDSNTTSALNCNNSKLNGSEFARYVRKNFIEIKTISCMFRGQYCRNNFHDYFASLILLFELTVVNQWHGKNTYIFFIKLTYLF
jgi:hypothetical protein